MPGEWEMARTVLLAVTLAGLGAWHWWPRLESPREHAQQAQRGVPVEMAPHAVAPPVASVTPKPEPPNIDSSNIEPPKTDPPPTAPSSMQANLPAPMPEPSDNESPNDELPDNEPPNDEPPPEIAWLETPPDEPSVEPDDTSPPFFAPHLPAPSMAVAPLLSTGAYAAEESQLREGQTASRDVAGEHWPQYRLSSPAVCRELMRHHRACLLLSNIRKTITFAIWWEHDPPRIEAANRPQLRATHSMRAFSLKPWEQPCREVSQWAYEEIAQRPELRSMLAPEADLRRELTELDLLLPKPLDEAICQAQRRWFDVRGKAWHADLVTEGQFLGLGTRDTPTFHIERVLQVVEGRTTLLEP